MGLFDRLRGRRPSASSPADEGSPDDETATADASDLAVDAVTTAAPGAAELARIKSGLARAGELGMGSGLESIEAAFLALLERQEAGQDVPGEDVTAVAFAIGDHLTRHGYRWALVSDPFGTDLGLEALRGRTTLVPHSLVAARWMRGDHGWVTGVVTHLIRIGGSR